MHFHVKTPTCVKVDAVCPKLRPLFLAVTNPRIPSIPFGTSGGKVTVGGQIIALRPPGAACLSTFEPIGRTARKRSRNDQDVFSPPLICDCNDLMARCQLTRSDPIERPVSSAALAI